MKYSDGCEIILDGEQRDQDAAYLEGPDGKLFKGFTSDIPDFEEEIASLPDPEPQQTDFHDSVRMRTIATPFAAGVRESSEREATATKCLSSAANGSALGMRGMAISPSRMARLSP